MAFGSKSLMKTCSGRTDLSPTSRSWLAILAVFSLFGFARADDVSGAVIWWLIFIMIMLGGSIAYLFYLVYFKKEPLSKKHPQFTGEHDVTTTEENPRRAQMERNKQNSREASGQSNERHSRRDPRTLDAEERNHQATKPEHNREPIDAGSIDVQENSKLSDDHEHGNKLNMPRVATGENSHRQAKQPAGILKNGINIAKSELDPSQTSKIARTTEQSQKQVTVPQVKAGIASFGSKMGASIAGKINNGVGVGVNEEEEGESEYEESEEEYEDADNGLNNIRATNMNINKQVIANVQSQASNQISSVRKQMKERPDD